MILRLKADAWPIRQFEQTVFHFRIVREPGEDAEHTRIRLAATEAKAADQMQRHLIAAVRENAFT